MSDKKQLVDTLVAEENAHRQRRKEYQSLSDFELVKIARDRIMEVDFYFFLRTPKGRASMKKDGRRPAPIGDIEESLREILGEAHDAATVLERRLRRMDGSEG